MSDFDDSGADSEDTQIARPNRYLGAPSTWLSLTEQERGLANTLTQLRNEDLSIHLYNAHALKKRAKEIKKKKISGELKSNTLDYNSDLDHPFTPPKSWTAWPLPSNIVPRASDSPKPDDNLETFTLRRWEPDRPSRRLEEALLAESLRIAKQKIEAQKWDDSDRDEDFKKEHVAKKRKLHGVKTTKSKKWADSPKDVHKNIESVPTFSSFHNNEDNGSLESPLKVLPERPPQVDNTRPGISTDDDRSRELLRPSIRHTLSKLDELLMALHHARKTCHEIHSPSESKYPSGIGDGALSSDSESLKKSPTAIRTGRGRPRNHENSTESPGRIQGNDHPNGDPSTWRAKSTKLGRPRKQYERLEGETEFGYLVRVARLQKKPIPVAMPPRDVANPEVKKSKPKPTPRKNFDEENANYRRKNVLCLRDWSEVIGSAALVDFPPDVIARATKRCSVLFGESMTLRTMVEAPAGTKDADRVELFTPETIPDFGGEQNLNVSSDSSSRSDNDSPYSDLESTRSTRRSRGAEGFSADRGMYLCPITTCLRHSKGFPRENNLQRHLRQSHQMKPEQVADYVQRTGRDMTGAVHVDGFLQPILANNGVRGKDKGKRKGGRWRKEQGGDLIKGEDDEDDADDTTDSDTSESE